MYEKTVVEWKTARKINAVFLAVVMLFSLVGGTMYHPMTAYANSVYSVSVSGDIINGTVTTNKENANEGDTITLVVTPDTDAEFYSLSVMCEKIIESEEEVNTINPGDILNYKQITKYVAAHSIEYDNWRGGSATFKAGDDKQAEYADHNSNKELCFSEHDEINEEYLSAHNWKCTDADSEYVSYEFIEEELTPRYIPYSQVNSA